MLVVQLTGPREPDVDTEPDPEPEPDPLPDDNSPPFPGPMGGAPIKPPATAAVSCVDSVLTDFLLIERVHSQGVHRSLRSSTCRR